MIIVVNGPFGVGKSTAAHLLVKRLPGAMLYDPEVIGFILRRVGRPLIKSADYQDLALWRGLTTWGAWIRSYAGYGGPSLCRWRYGATITSPNSSQASTTPTPTYAVSGSPPQRGP